MQYIGPSLVPVALSQWNEWLSDDKLKLKAILQTADLISLIDIDVRTS